MDCNGHARVQDMQIHLFFSINCVLSLIPHIPEKGGFRNASVYIVGNVRTPAALLIYCSNTRIIAMGCFVWTMLYAVVAFFRHCCFPLNPTGCLYVVGRVVHGSGGDLTPHGPGRVRSCQEIFKNPRVGSESG